jgi:hypothetical protein
MPAHERSKNDPTTAHTDSTGESITVLTYTLPLTANLVFCSLLLLAIVLLVFACAYCSVLCFVVLVL